MKIRLLGDRILTEIITERELFIDIIRDGKITKNYTIDENGIITRNK